MSAAEPRGTGGADEAPPSGEPAIRLVAMPADTNPSGDIFGGWLMSQMDSAGGLVAARRARGRVATVAVDAMVFDHPVHVGDVVSVYADIIAVGRTSLRVAVVAWSRHRNGEESRRVTRATFTFVAIGGDGRPRIVTPEQERRRRVRA